jgi:hypothetical protein
MRRWFRDTVSSYSTNLVTFIIDRLPEQHLGKIEAYIRAERSYRDLTRRTKSNLGID